MAVDPSSSVVVITGASSGIGAALARELAGRHASVVLASRREQVLRGLAATLDAAVEVVPADVTRRADVQRILDQAVARFGRVDVWVNNAGRGISRPSVLSVSTEDLETMIRDNTASVLHGIQVAVPHFQARGEGVLVNVSSMLSRVPSFPVRAAYSASKAAVNSLTESLRFELEKTHPKIRVMLVLPGVVGTDFGNNAIGGGVDSRSIPGAQRVEDVARIMADGLFSGPLDLYTRPEGLERVLGHLRTLAGT